MASQGRPIVRLRFIPNFVEIMLSPLICLSPFGKLNPTPSTRPPKRWTGLPAPPDFPPPLMVDPPPKPQRIACRADSTGGNPINTDGTPVA